MPFTPQCTFNSNIPTINLVDTISSNFIMFNPVFAFLSLWFYSLVHIFQFRKLFIPKKNVTTGFTPPIPPSPDARTLSVNFHFTRKCNYECGFCFHTAKSSYLTPLENAKIGLKKLRDQGMKKLNFSGGEPFLHPTYLGELCKFSKSDLALESVSIVSNGSKIKRSFFAIYGEYLDILAISVDSFDEDTNVKIGRGKGKHLQQLNTVRDLCTEFGVKFKLNTVVNKYNHKEDFTPFIEGLDPFRWKCFQVLPVDTENVGTASRRDCSDFLITAEDFEKFCQAHCHLKCFVPKSNTMMKSSYLILDEYMRFLNKGDKYAESPSILDVSIEEALRNTDYQPDVFYARGGVYDWRRDGNRDCNSETALDF